MTIETYLSDLGTYLQTAGIGTINTDIHFHGLASNATNDITLIQFPGAEYNKIVSGEVNPYSPNLSILIRNTSGATAHSKATAIYKLLRDVSNRTIGSTHFLMIQAQGSPGFVSKTQNYFIFSINFSLLIQ